MTKLFYKNYEKNCPSPLQHVVQLQSDVDSIIIDSSLGPTNTGMEMLLTVVCDLTMSEDDDSRVREWRNTWIS